MARTPLVGRIVDPAGNPHALKPVSFRRVGAAVVADASGTIGAPATLPDPVTDAEGDLSLTLDPGTYIMSFRHATGTISVLVPVPESAVALDIWGLIGAPEVPVGEADVAAEAALRAAGDAVAVAAGTASVRAWAASESAGRGAVADGETFLVVTAGNFEHRRRDSSVVSTLLKSGSKIRLDRYLPEMAAAASLIVTACATLRRKAVPLALVLGTAYNPGTAAALYADGTDFATTWNAASATLFGAGLHVTGEDGLEITAKSQVYWRNGWDTRWKGTVIHKAWSTTGAGNSLFHNETIPASDAEFLTGINWDGGTINVPVSAATLAKQAAWFANPGSNPTPVLADYITGGIIRFHAHNVTISNLTIRNWVQGQAIFANGNNARIPNLDAQTFFDPGDDLECGGVRQTRGSGFRCWSGQVQCKNDVLVFAAATNTTGSLPNSSISDGRFDHMVAITRNGKQCTVGVSDGNPTNTFTGTVRDVEFADISGTCGEIGMRVICDDGKDTVIDQIDDVRFTRVRTRIVNGTAGRDGVQVNSTYNRGIGRVTYDGCEVDASAVRAAVNVNAPGCVLTFIDHDTVGLRTAMDVYAAAKITVAGGRWGIADGASTTPDDPEIDPQDEARHGWKFRDGWGGVLETVGVPYIWGIASPVISGSARFYSGIRMQSGDGYVPQVRIDKAAGASGTKAFRCTAGTFSWGDVQGTIDNKTMEGAATERRLALPMAVGSAGPEAVLGKAVVAAGSAAAPGYTFAGDTDTGIYSSAMERIAFAVTGQQVAHFRSDRFDLAVQLRAQSGNAGAPGVAGTGDTDTGFYWPNDNTVRGSFGGTQALQASTAGLLVGPLVGSGKGFVQVALATRADVVAWRAAATPVVGAVLTAPGVGGQALRWRYIGTGTAIDDMPGWVPDGIATPNHFSENTTPGTTDMLAAINALLTYVSTRGRIGYLLPETYYHSATLTFPAVRGVCLVGTDTARTAGDSFATRLICDSTSGPQVRRTHSNQDIRGITVRATGARAAASFSISTPGILTEYHTDTDTTACEANQLTDVLVTNQPGHAFQWNGPNFMHVQRSIAARDNKGAPFFVSDGTATSRTNKSRPGGFQFWSTRAVGNASCPTFGDRGTYGVYRFQFYDADWQPGTQDGALNPQSACLDLHGESCEFHGVALDGRVGGTVTLQGAYVSGRGHQWFTPRFVGVAGLMTVFGEATIGAGDMSLSAPIITNDCTVSPAIVISGTVGHITVFAPVSPGGAGLATVSSWFSSGYTAGVILSAARLDLGQKDLTARTVTVPAVAEYPVNINRDGSATGWEVVRTGTGASTLRGSTRNNNGELELNGNPFGGTVLTVADDAVGVLTPPKQGVALLMWADGGTAFPKDAFSVFGYFDTGSSLQVAKLVTTIGSSVDVVTTDVAGTTGTDGRVTVAARSGQIKVENRSGASITFTAVML